MTTPKKLKPGQVPQYAGWVGDAIPQAQRDAQSRAGARVQHVPNLSSVLPDYVDRATFEAWLDGPLGIYRAHAQLVRQIPPLSADVEWLRDALRDLERGDTKRLQNTGALVMPGRTHSACFVEAHKAGIDWPLAVANGGVESLRKLVLAAIEALQRQPPRKGPKVRERDKLLNAISEKLMTYKRPAFLSSGKEVEKRVLRAQSLRIAADVLLLCGVATGSKSGVEASVKRAARRGKG